MAKIVKMDPDTQSEENKIEKLKQAVWDDFMKGMSEKDKKFVENLNIKSFDDICAFLSAGGFDPLKVLKGINESETLEEFQSKDLSFDEDDPRSDFSSHGPRQLFLDEKDVKEYHIRIKLDNAPVKIWRELKVPSNISLEYLAKLLIEAMGWFDSHLHQFRKKDVFYKSTEDLEYEKENFFFFESNSRHLDANDHSLTEVLPEKGDRIVFEYDFGDGWLHDVWVKNIRDYEPDEHPEIVLVKGKGACPPEDCGGVWGYEELLYLLQKKRKTKEEKERLEWYGIDSHYDPEEYDLDGERAYFYDLFGLQDDE